MNGWGPSDDGFATREATIADGIEWAVFRNNSKNSGNPKSSVLIVMRKSQ